jgi:hypothetical protein
MKPCSYRYRLRLNEADSLTVSYFEKRKIGIGSSKQKVLLQVEANN